MLFSRYDFCLLSLLLLYLYLPIENTVAGPPLILRIHGVHQYSLDGKIILMLIIMHISF